MTMTDPQNKTYTIKIGTSDFKKLITESTLFVDKTLLIKSILEDGHEVILVTRPRRWGKTLNMTMLEYFFSVPVHGDGTLNTEEHLKKCDIFSKLKIGEYPNFIKEHCGKYPAIFVSFKDVKAKRYEELERTVRDIVYQIYSSHKYLLHSDKIDGIQKTLFKKFITKEFDLSELKKSLFYLSEMLHRHFGQKVIILIDEYDTPLNDWYAQQFIQEGTSPAENERGFQDVLSLFSGILSSTLKDNTFLEKSMLTGILCVAKASIFSGLNNLGEDSILDNRYAEHFGFTEKDVNTLLHTSGLDKNQKISENMKFWYNGYTIGGLTIYNPWSIMNYLNSPGEFKAYWVGTASTALIEKALIQDKFQEKIQTLIEGGSIEMIADSKMVFSDITTSPNALYNLLLFSGYLTASSVETPRGGTYRCDVHIPNREVLEVFEISTTQWLSQKFKIEVDEYDAFLNDLLKGDINTFTQKLKLYLEVSASFYATGPKNAEIFYNGFMIGLVSAVSSRYLIEAEKESGGGRVDLMLIPKPTAKYRNAVILEFKLAKLGEDLAILAQKGL
ncbi:MAG: hypothetical protein B7Y25_00130 [Alphaproteobacteria bacterium 16-39-46]|nr:MAG: hypothetical protein B7Y25_00130 [Alphaproteobacteria bacterium 16-39-46]OZA44535.1 MAG: hypothetical protein B7X84_00190 [Alphaproteobacteria bacterium 17-39-52]